MSDISPSALGEGQDAEFEKAVAACTSAEQIKSLMAARTVANGYATRDAIDPNILIPTGKTTPAPQPTRLSRVVEFGGQRYTVEGNNEAELLAAENSLYKQAFSGDSHQNDQPRGADGRFLSPEEVEKFNAAEITRQSELELKFKRGEIDTATYLRDSGAIEKHLAEQGVDIEALKVASQEKSEEAYTHSWEVAVQEFLNSPEASDYVGGQESLRRMGEVLGTMNDSVTGRPLSEMPSKETLAAAWQYLKDTGNAPRNEELEHEQAIVQATRVAKSPSELRSMLDSIRAGSGVFNR